MIVPDLSVSRKDYNQWRQWRVAAVADDSDRPAQPVLAELRQAVSLPAKILSPAAIRALAEAEARRARQQQAALPAEINGRKGPEPTRYGDWETKGIISDF